jgi:lysophospholipase L1-like esterase
MLLTAAIVFTLISKPLEGFFYNERVIADHKVRSQNKKILTKIVDPTFFPKDINIVALGDSLTIGFGDQSQNGGYLTYLESSLVEQREIKNVTIENFGVGGLRSSQLVNKLDQSSVLYALRYSDVVLITIGGNDIIQVVQDNFLSLSDELFDQANEKFVVNVHSIVKAIRDVNPSSQIYFLGVYNPLSDLFPQVTEIDQIIENWNRNMSTHVTTYENTYFVPLYDVFKGNEQLYLYEDYIHPNKTGYEHMARRVLGYMEQYHYQSTYVSGHVE